MKDAILAIHDGHTATAAVIGDGKVLSCVSEERLNGIKEWGGIPRLAIREAIRIAGLQPSDISHVVVPSYINPVTSMESGRKSHAPHAPTVAIPCRRCRNGKIP